jgi:hypothetical protein
VSALRAAANGRSDAPAALLAAHARVPEHVVYRSFIRETVLLNLTTGHYHSIDPANGRILDLLAGGATLGMTAQALTEEDQRPLADVEWEICSFCQQLRGRGLIELTINGGR